MNTRRSFPTTDIFPVEAAGVGAKGVKLMACYFRILSPVLLVSIPLFGQSQNPAKAGQAAIGAFGQKAALAAVNFLEGDSARLTHARGDFTSDGWKDFMKHLEGFLDENGAPSFTSTFVPSGSATVLSEEAGVVHFKIPGTLTQNSKLGRTTYRAAIEVHAGGKPVRIQHLEQITCSGASTACQ